MKGSIFKRGERWSVRFDEPTEDGRRRQRRKGGFATRREAQEWLAEQQTRIRDGSYTAPSKITVADFLTVEWLPAVEGKLRPLTHERYASIVRHVVVPRIGHKRLQGLSGGVLTAFYGELQDELAASTRRLVHSVLRRALNDAVRWGRIVRNPAQLADPPRDPVRRPKVWTASELTRFLEQVRGDRLFALWRLAATTGMRRGELAGVTWRALDLDGGRLEVSQQIVRGRGGVGFGPLKSAHSRRTVALDSETVEAFRAHREVQLTERDFAGDSYADQDLVFADELGGPLVPSISLSCSRDTARRPGSRPGRCTSCATPRRR